MPLYSINYDLNKQKNYPALYEAIKALGPWCHPLDSLWFVQTTIGSAAIRDRVKSAMDQDDALLVSKVATGDSAWVGMTSEVSSWLKANM